MRTPISGICVGFRIVRGQGKDASDFAKLHVLQVGTKDLDPDLIEIYVQSVELIGDLLDRYSSGALRWIDTYCYTAAMGRDTVWVLERIFAFENRSIEVIA